MLVKKFDEHNSIIKHMALVDSESDFSDLENDFCVLENSNNSDVITFYKFIQSKFESKDFAIQIFEIVDNKVSFNEYFASETLWENKQLWDNWEARFKDKHKFLLYFFNPKKNKKDSINELIRLSSFSEKYRHSQIEYFELSSADFFLNNNDMTGEFYVQIFSNVIKKYLEQSRHDEFKNLITEFNYLKLQEQIPQSTNKTTKNKV